jgi:hypothetical protein
MSRNTLRLLAGIAALGLASAASAQTPGFDGLSGPSFIPAQPKGTRADDLLGKVPGPIDFRVIPSLQKWAEEQSTYPNIVGWLGDTGSNSYQDYRDTMDRIRQAAHDNEEAALAWLHARAGKMARYYEEMLLPTVKKIESKVGADHGRLNTGHARDRRNRVRRIPYGMLSQYRAAFATFDEAYQNQIVGFVSELSPEVSKYYMNFYRDVARFNLQRNQHLLEKSNAEYARMAAGWKTEDYGDWSWVPGTLDHLHPFTTKWTRVNDDISRRSTLVKQSKQILQATRDFQESFDFLVQVRSAIFEAAQGDTTRNAYLESRMANGEEARLAEFHDSYEFAVIQANRPDLVNQ